MSTADKSTAAKIEEVLETCRAYGESSIIALAGAPGTGKSYIGSIAAQRLASTPLMVREVQFHQSFTYEEFIEGLRIDHTGAVIVTPGAFLEWNDQAHDDPEHHYVFLVEELTRANVSAVLGELLTYVEQRDRQFLTIYSRRPVKIAKNLTVIATYNPTDRSAIDMDTALLRRLRIITFPPSVEQLGEMLKARGLGLKVIDKLKETFERVRARHADEYENLMPFGHGIFAEIRQEAPDLHKLWEERLRHFLYRPLIEPHPFASSIEENYPWTKRDYTVP
jgi:5-methylcytosine-specific restriction endonuclease McrBC GTP-binding regulatory subunit McrB